MALGRSTLTPLLWYLCLCCFVPPSPSRPVWVFHKVVLECPFMEKGREVDLDKVTVLWDHDGRTMAEYKAGGSIVTFDSRVNMSMEELKLGKASLNLSNLSRTDSGRYTCTVQYGSQKVPFQYKVEVTERQIQIQHLSSGSSKHYAMTKARFTNQLHRQPAPMLDVTCVTARPGGSITLNCTSRSSTPFQMEQSTIMWTKDGEVISFQNRTCCGNRYPESYAEGNLVMLQLSHLTAEHAGTYNCYLKHNSMEESYDIILQITENSACSDFSDEDLQRRHGPIQPHRELQIGLVAGVAGTASILAIALYFGYRG